MAGKSKGGKRKARTYVGKSKIHGRGLFAARDIPKDVVVMDLEGVVTLRDGPHVIWSADESGEEEGLRVTNDARYVNHADKPNAVFVGMELWSLRRIRKGEEITHNYTGEV